MSDESDNQKSIEISRVITNVPSILVSARREGLVTDNPKYNRSDTNEHASFLDPEVDSLGNWYNNDILACEKEVQQYIILIEFLKKSDDTEILPVVEKTLADAQFYLAVQRKAAIIDRKSLEELHTLYSEGAAWYVYGELEGRNIRKQWRLAIEEYVDTLGVTQAVKETMGIIENKDPDDLDYKRLRSQAYDKVFKGVLRVLADSRSVEVVYGERGQQVTVRVGNKERKLTITSNGCHTFLSKPIEANGPVHTLEHYNDWQIIAIANDRLPTSSDTDVNRLNRISILAHEAGHMDELEQPLSSVRINGKLKLSKTGAEIKYQTEYFSTMLSLQVLREIYRVTHDDQIIEVVARQASLHNLIVYGDPKNALTRANNKKKVDVSTSALLS